MVQHTIGICTPSFIVITLITPTHYVMVVQKSPSAQGSLYFMEHKGSILIIEGHSHELGSRMIVRQAFFYQQDMLTINFS